MICTVMIRKYYRFLLCRCDGMMECWKTGKLVSIIQYSIIPLFQFRSEADLVTKYED